MRFVALELSQNLDSCLFNPNRYQLVAALYAVSCVDNNIADLQRSLTLARSIFIPCLPLSLSVLLHFEAMRNHFLDFKVSKASKEPEKMELEVVARWWGVWKFVETHGF